MARQVGIYRKIMIVLSARDYIVRQRVPSRIATRSRMFVAIRPSMHQIAKNTVRKSSVDATTRKGRLTIPFAITLVILLSASAL